MRSGASVANSEMPLKTYFGEPGVKSAMSFVVDRQVRCQDEEVVYPVGEVQVADEGPHEARFADARGERKANRWELPLEILRRGKFAVDGRQCRGDVDRLGRAGDFCDPVEDFERLPLGGRRLSRPEMALTWRFIVRPPLQTMTADRRAAEPWAGFRRAGCSHLSRIRNG